ncbi:hypothetical protein V6N11_070100 [Hibiscus sabdariffa]|uniref:Uncharacterized protein n=2 Tax=Hibiscus sabdariffa TaxID=183260 RepID=A0ABR2QE10_9ROSI
MRLVTSVVILVSPADCFAYCCCCMFPMGTDDQSQASSRPLSYAILVSSFLSGVICVIGFMCTIILRICGVEYGLVYLLTIVCWLLI